MKIKYRIIWFEDQDRWLKSAIPFVEDNLLDKGFEPVIESYKRATNINQSLWNKINLSDLIIMDLNLDNGLKGNKIIKQIRDNNILTEVIFYSQAGEDKLRTLIHNEELDGVYCSERKESWKKVNQVIDMNIKKAQDVNALRGLVMAEEADLQNMTANILWKLHKNKHTLASFIRKHALDKTTEHFSKTLIKLSKLDAEKNYKDLFNMYQYGASGKQITLNAFLEETLKTKNIFKPAFLVMKKYNEEIIEPRNLLAHSTEREIKGKIFLVNKKERKEFTELECIKIRKNLKKHRENLEEVFTLIDKK